MTKMHFLVLNQKTTQLASKHVFGKISRSEWVNAFLLVFAGIALKLEKVGPAISSLNPSPSLPSVVSEDRKQFHCLYVILNNITGPLFLGFKKSVF